MGDSSHFRVRFRLSNRLNIGNKKEHIGMPGVKHQIPDPNDAVIKAVAHKIHQKRKQIEKARNEEEAREMEKKRKEDEKRKKLDQQSKSLVAVKDELEQLHTKDCFNGKVMLDSVTFFIVIS